MKSNKKEKLSDADFCVIVPMYNEENNANECVKSICEFLKNIENRSELLVVDDGSKDKTSKKLSELKKNYKNLNIKTHKSNLGYGKANQTGIKYAHENKYKYVLFMDSDLTQDTKYILDFINLMNKDLDFIKATRYSSGGGSKGVNIFRKFVSKVGNIIAKIFLRLPINDYTNGFRAIKTELVFNLNHKENGFGYLIEEVNKVSKKAKSFGEVPYILSARNDSDSKSKFTYSFDVYLSYLKWVFKK